MNYLVIGDLHLKLSNLEVADSLFKYVDKIIDENSHNTSLIFLGDIYDVKSIIRVEVQNFFYRYLTEILDKYKITATIILGNHDYTNLNLVDHSFGFHPYLLSSKQVIHIVDIPYVDREQKMMFVPFMVDNKKFLESLDMIKEEENYTLFCHQPFAGYYLNVQNKVMEENGVDSKSIDNRITSIIAGHFHSFQEKGKVVYLGSPFAHTFAEANEDKKLLFIDSKGKYKYFSTIGVVPQYYSIETDLSRLLNENTFKYESHDFVKFIVRDTEVNCSKVTKQFLISLMEQNKIPKCDNVYIQYYFTDGEIDVEIDENQSVFQMFEDYVSLYLKDYSDKELLLKLGKNKYLKNAIV